MRLFQSLIIAAMTMLSTTVFAAISCNVAHNSLQFSEAEVRAKVTETMKAVQGYLDARTGKWTKEKETRDCLCCHTTMSYAMSRSLDAKSKANFDRMSALSKSRIDNWETNDAWYAQDRAHKASFPTESVLYANALVMHNIKAGKNLSSITRESLDLMLSQQQDGGGLHWLNFKLEPFESKKAEVWGNSLALLNVGLASTKLGYRPAKPAQLKQLKHFVADSFSRSNLNSQAMALWAAKYNPGLLSNSQKNQIITALKKAQSSDGSWSAKAITAHGPKEVGDVYSTSIATIALLEHGMKDSSTQKAIEWLISQQKRVERDSLTYWAISSKSTNRDARITNTHATDAATGFATLALDIFNNGSFLGGD